MLGRTTNDQCHISEVHTKTERKGGGEWEWEFGWFSMASTFTFVLRMPFNNPNKSDYNQYYLHFVIFAALIHFNHIDIFTSLSLFVATALRIRVVIFLIQFPLFSFPFLLTLLTSFHSLFLFSSFFPVSPSASIYVFSVYVCVCTLLWFGHKCI